MKDAIILALLFALAVIGLGQSRDPQPAIQDTTGGIFHRAQLGAPDDAHPILQRCNPIASGEQPMAAIGIEQEPVT